MTLTGRGQEGVTSCTSAVQAGIYDLTLSVQGRPEAAATVEVRRPEPSLTSLTGTGDTRYWHASALVGRTRVLTVGGYSDGAYAKTYVVDPALGRGEPVQDPLLPRVKPALVSLPDGRALLIGGYRYALDPTPVLEVFDPGTGKWTLAGLLTRPRGEVTATLLADGTVLVLSNESDGASGEIFDPATGLSRPVAKPIVSLTWSTASRLADGRVLVAGTHDKSAAVFDPRTGTWIAVGPTTRVRSFASGTLLADGRYLLVGGVEFGSYWADADLFDPATHSWSRTTAMPGGRSQHTTTLLGSGLVLVLGGRDVGGALSDHTAQLYDPGANVWASAPTAGNRYTHTATQLPSGALVVIGGGDDSPARRPQPRDLVYAP